MSQFDPTHVEEHAGEEGIAEMTENQLYEEVTALTNGELGIREPTLGAETPAPADTMPEAPPVPKAPAIPVPAEPVPPTRLLKKAVSGCYTGSLDAFQVELRVDVDRARPMRRISGDFFQLSGSTLNYFGSFVVDTPIITTTPTQIVARGPGRFTFNAGAPVVQVTIPRVNIFQRQAAATLQFLTTTNSAGVTYHCAYQSSYFRNVLIETDRVSDVTLPIFSSYNTGSLPSGGTARTLGVVGAYAEAGIGMVPTSGGDVIDISEAQSDPTQADVTWSDAELHASMQKHFSKWRDIPQWCVWQVVAQLHEMGPGLYGIMFDQEGKQRQGCAVFHAGIGGTTPDKLRLQLYTYVHELGHCFNLMHSWQKQYATPPATNRPKALSWMNYPWNFPDGGASTFWNKFDFRFDDEELIHLRHGFRNDVIMGGNPFTAGAALGRDVLPDPIRDDSGLALDISTQQKSYALGEPVFLQLKLRPTDTRGRRAHTWLHPNDGLVRIVISKPGGEVVAYEPMIDHLVGDRQTILANGDEVQDSAYIGFGKGGFYFDQPGRYRIRAAYTALDGSLVLSNIHPVNVRYPVNAEDEELAELFMGSDAQGAVLYLRGSDSEFLTSGMDAFRTVVYKYGTHRMAAYAQMVIGINSERTFKTVSNETASRLTVRQPDPQESTALLTAAAQANVLDPVSTRTVMTHLAAAHLKAGNADAFRQITATCQAMGIRTS